MTAQKMKPLHRFNQHTSKQNRKKPTKANLQYYRDFILNQLEAGIIDAVKVQRLFSAKFGVTDRTFYKYWKVVSAEFSEMQEAIANDKKAKFEEAAKEVNKNILERSKAVEMQSNIAKLLYNKIVVDKDNPNTKASAALTSVLEWIAKAEGWNAVIKQEFTISKGLNIDEYLRLKDERE